MVQSNPVLPLSSLTFVVVVVAAYPETIKVKVAIDQFIQAPALLALIISGMSIMQGKGIDGMKLDMRHEYVSTLIKNCELRMLGCRAKPTFCCLIFF